MDFDTYNQTKSRLIGEDYENMMRYFFPNQKTKRNGVDRFLMICLVDTERNIKPYGQPSRNKQCLNIKNHIHRILQKLINQGVQERDLNYLLDIEESLEYCGSSFSFMLILRRLHDFDKDGIITPFNHRRY
ncbi:hypothetical protein [Litoribacter populi]|uniref:hypothetical protein n=1 Tax=Litoribacter populi TaxID=2598460 RepID=UPI00117F9D4A|nr:hypothetical protein [Litoribacter populi]